MYEKPLPGFLQFAFSICLSAGVFAQTSVARRSGQQTTAGPARAARSGPDCAAACIRAHMEFLASDALRGRGSGTADELVAATYVAAQLRAYGIAPAGDNGGYLQRATLLQPKFTAPPQLTFASSPAEKKLPGATAKNSRSSISRKPSSQASCA